MSFLTERTPGTVRATSLALSMSARLSATMQSAQVAAKALDGTTPIEIIDSYSASMGIGNLALHAARRARAERGVLVGRVVFLGVILLMTLLSPAALLAVQGALLLLSLLLLLRTFRIDAASEKRLFPPRPLAIRTPVGAAYWIFILFSVTHTALGMFLPLSLQVLHGVTALAAGYSVAAFALSWTAASFLTASWRGAAERRAILGGPLLTAVSLCLLTLTIDNGSVYVIYPLVIGAGLGIGAAGHSRRGRCTSNYSVIRCRAAPRLRATPCRSRAQACSALPGIVRARSRESARSVGST